MNRYRSSYDSPCRRIQPPLETWHRMDSLSRASNISQAGACGHFLHLTHPPLSTHPPTSTISPFQLHMPTVVTSMIRAKVIRRPLREAISRGFSALRVIIPAVLRETAGYSKTQSFEL